MCVIDIRVSQRNLPCTNARGRVLAHFHLLRDEFILDPDEFVIGRTREMIIQEPQSYRLSGPLSKAQAIMGFVLLVLLLSPGSLAAASMKLLAPNIGWAAYGNKLYWTYNNGADWADITPALPDVRPEAIRSVLPPFFRDTSEGWTIVEYQRQAGSPQISETAYSVAHTVDSGASWSFTELTYPQLPEWIQETIAGPVSLFFIDSLHGWLDIAFAGNARPGKLLATVDGGKTWNWVNSSGFSGPITFATLLDGWQIGYFGADKLYGTHDGCKTWSEVSGLPLPHQVSSGAERRLYGLPIFQDQYKGYLAVEYLVAGGGPTKLVIYSTSDTGKSWQPAKVLDQAPEAVGGIFDIVDSTIIVSTGSSAKNVSVATVALNGGASGVKASDRGITRLKFADNLNGWILTADYRVLATQDGGSSWKDITPPSSAPALRTETVPIPQKGLAMTVTSADTLAAGVAASASTYGSNTRVSKHLGFDMSRVRPVSDMQTWWQYSPYYDTYIYLPGAPNRGVDANLTSNWVTQVKNQGWGVIPIWFGLQAPAGCPNATFTSYMDPANAAAQGKAEADSAASAADALGLSKTVIYKDIKNYTINSQCSPPVIAFVSAWVSELHNKGYSAGVYANPDPANQDI